MNSYWKVKLELPIIEGLKGTKAETEGFEIYPIFFPDFKQKLQDFKIRGIEEFACTKAYRLKLGELLETQERYISGLAIHEVSYKDDTGEHQVENTDREFRVLYGRYVEGFDIHLNKSGDSCILPKGDFIMFLFECTQVMERFKLLGITSHFEDPSQWHIYPSFFDHLQAIFEKTPTLKTPEQRLLIVDALKHILWLLLDAPFRWDPVLWLTQYGLYAYPEELFKSFPPEDRIGLENLEPGIINQEIAFDVKFKD
jgi:hypothetical protein